MPPRALPVKGEYRLTSKVVPRAEAAKNTRGRGRPPGARNKLKTITPSKLKEFQERLGEYIPPEDLGYFIEVLKGERKSELFRDLDILLAMEFKALLPQLAAEIDTRELSREATQRSSTIKELLALKLQLEKAGRADEGPDATSLIQRIISDRSSSGDEGRLAALLGIRVIPSDPQPPGLLSGILHNNQGEADSSGTISDQLPERLVDVAVGGQV
jgi:hypothetical protein